MVDLSTIKSIVKKIYYWPRKEKPTSMEDFCLFLLLDKPSKEEIAILAIEFLEDERFFFETNTLSFKYRKRPFTPAGWSIVHYIVTRIMKPNIIVETGVFDGHSSACWLLALEKNQSGSLISIDLPARNAIADSIHESLPKGLQPGWIIPSYLKTRHKLILGDAKEILPKVLKENAPVDIFFHDSLHTEEHMLFEFTQAYSSMSKGGLILSDDYKSYNAFSKFCKKIGRRYFYSYNGLAGLRV